jgi:hypothetical protein
MRVKLVVHFLRVYLLVYLAMLQSGSDALDAPRQDSSQTGLARIDPFDHVTVECETLSSHDTIIASKAAL